MLLLSLLLLCCLLLLVAVFSLCSVVVCPVRTVLLCWANCCVKRLERSRQVCCVGAQQTIATLCWRS